MKNISKLLLLSGTVTAMLLIVSIAGISIALGNRNASKNDENKVKTEFIYVFESKKQDEESKESKPESVYILKEYEGKIGVFDKSNQLIRFIDVYTKTLPKADRNLLREGIEVSSKKELEAIIEDYSS